MACTVKPWSSCFSTRPAKVAELHGSLAFDPLAYLPMAQAKPKPWSVCRYNFLYYLEGL